MPARPILVQMADTRWTWAALYEACAHARQTGSEIILLRMLPAGYLAWTGDLPEEYRFTESETEDLSTYKHIAAEQGVPLSVRIVQYDDFDRALLELADEFDAQIVFAEVEHNPLVPLLYETHVHQLEHDLAEHEHGLRALELHLL